MSYFSKIMLRPNITPTLLLGKQNRSYRIHQLLWQLFPEQDKRNFLFREYYNRCNQLTFYVLSNHAPSQQHKALLVESKAFAPKLVNGQSLAFDLRANPVVSYREPSANPKGSVKRHDVLMSAKRAYKLANPNNHDKVAEKTVMTQAAIDWINNPKRLSSWGIALATQPDVNAYQQHRMQRRKQSISIASIDYQGILTITNVRQFQYHLSRGFGKAKAFGCGLMLIRPV